MPATEGLPGDELYSLFSAIVESSDDAIISEDLNGVITSWNPAATRMFGYSPEEMIGQPVLRLFPDELRYQEEEILGRLRAGQRLEHFETVRLRKDGTRVHVALTISPIIGEGGEVVGGSKIVRDISDRKNSDEAQSRLAAIVESSDDAIIGKDLNGIITSWNKSAVRVFGYTPAEIIGKSIRTLIPPELQGEEDYILGQVRRGERVEHFETERLAKSGKRLMVSVTVSPIKDSRGKVIGVSKIARDVTQRRQIELALVQSEKLAATGRMAATIAHEINNPLEAVVNLIFLARSHPSLDESVKNYLLTAEKEIERVSLIARQTLGFYRETTTPTAVVVHDLVSDVLTIYQSRFRSRSISVETSFEPVRALTVRKGEVTQVLSNLISNSIDAMPDGGCLQVAVRESLRESDGIEIVIKDQGVGIKPEDLSHLYEPFFTTKKNVGTGLGLWIVKQFLDNHLGGISVQSNAAGINRGTTFTIFLPFANPFDAGDEASGTEQSWAPAAGE